MNIKYKRLKSAKKNCSRAIFQKRKTQSVLGTKNNDKFFLCFCFLLYQKSVCDASQNFPSAISRSNEEKNPKLRLKAEVSKYCKKLIKIQTNHTRSWLIRQKIFQTSKQVLPPIIADSIIDVRMSQVQLRGSPKKAVLVGGNKKKKKTNEREIVEWKQKGRSNRVN